MTEFRTEKDSLGEVRVPAHAFYGAQTQRAVDNFHISGITLPGGFHLQPGPDQGCCRTSQC